MRDPLNLVQPFVYPVGRRTYEAVSDRSVKPVNTASAPPSSPKSVMSLSISSLVADTTEICAVMWCSGVR